MAPLTLNQATILAAVLAAIVSALISAITSIAITKYSLKKAPDYRSQIDALNQSVKTLFETQERVLIQQTALAETAEKTQSIEDARREASSWRPNARLESSYDGRELRNELLLKSDQQFALIEVNLLSSSGARVATIETATDPVSVRTTGYRIHISHSDILKIVNSSQEWFQTSQAHCAVQYIVDYSGVRNTFELPCRAISDTRGSTGWVRLEG